MHPAEQFGLAIALAHLDVNTQHRGLRLDERYQLGVGDAAVDGGLSFTQTPQIGSIENLNRHSRTPSPRASPATTE
ncbi:Uncharacterised protein [Mycobacteroides abscessus subsp. abscessus]|nr:Uncharacterised protein [Mycobacteroides abscessus subsp. abscessus]